MSTPVKLSRKDFVPSQEVRWCPGCGDYAILAQLQKVLPELGVPRENFVFVSGIGCSSRFPYYMNTYGFHTIHGRAPAFATGVKLANPELSVWVVTGDGDGFSIGGNHMLHVLRRNVDMQIMLFNNRIYGLTKGQYSPTSREGMVTKSSPQGSIDHPVDPVSFALGAGATFVARTVDVDAKSLQDVLQRAHAHKGTAFIEILQTCVVFNPTEWDEFENRKDRQATTLQLENGKPLVFGEPGALKGIRIQDGVPSVIDLAEGEDPLSRGVAVHQEDASSPGYAAILASLARPEFPTPIGILRAVNRPVYDEMVQIQKDDAVAKRGRGTVEKLLNSGQTWTVHG